MRNFSYGLRHPSFPGRTRSQGDPRFEGDFAGLVRRSQRRRLGTQLSQGREHRFALADCLVQQELDVMDEAVDVKRGCGHNTHGALAVD